MEKNIRSILPTKCPHCSEPIFVEFGSSAPTLIDVIREEDIAVAKDMVREKINASSVDDEKKKTLLELIDSPETVFGLADVDAVVEDLLS